MCQLFLHVNDYYYHYTIITTIFTDQSFVSF